MAPSIGSQTVGDLRTLVVRRAGVGRRVALLSSDASLRAALEQNRCTVLLDPESLEALRAFRPDVVVAFDGFLGEREQGLRLLSTAAPEAELVLSFANAASASALLRALGGATPAPGASELEVTGWLASAGYALTAKDLVISAPPPSGLCADTEAALRQLFEQLNPSAGADRLLLCAKRGAAASRPERVKGLVSVVIAAGQGELQPLKGTLGSVLAQTRKPLEVILASPLTLEQSDAALSAVRGRGNLTAFTVASASEDWAVSSNLGLEPATGQYVTFLQAGELLAPRHLELLATRLEQATAAWALSSPPAPHSGPFKLAGWLEHGSVNRARWLVDRERLGAFALTFAEGAPLAEAMLFTRLALLFAPACTGGKATVDSPREGPVDVAGLLTLLKARPLRTLTTLEALFEKPALASLLEERLESLKPGAGRTLGRALSWWKALPVDERAEKK